MEDSPIRASRKDQSTIQLVEPVSILGRGMGDAPGLLAGKIRAPNNWWNQCLYLGLGNGGFPIRTSRRYQSTKQLVDPVSVLGAGDRRIPPFKKKKKD